MTSAHDSSESRSYCQAVTPRVFPTTGFKTIPTSETVEEEHWAWYTLRSFYPVCIGDVFQDRYQVLFKLGYGTTATTWMCRDLQIEDRNYHFLVHEPLGAPLEFCLEGFDTGFPIDYARDLARQMLHTLEFIHSAEVVHADLQASNILLRIQDKSILKDGEEYEIQRPSSREMAENTIIFETRDLPGPLSRWIGEKSMPVLCDFGEARTGEKSYTQFIQPAIYRAPEIFLHLPWSTPVDIWNFGCMIWTFLFGHHLFSPSRRGVPDPQTGDKNQVAYMAALLGLPPPQLVVYSGPRALDFFNEDSSAKGDIPGEITLESVLKSSLERKKESMTHEEAAAFLAFIRRALTWTQEERATAAELLQDPWIRKFSETDPSQLLPRLA